jgi:hypothetical protein
MNAIMKRFGIILVFLIAIIACSGNKKKAQPPAEVITESGLANFMYKVDGIQDSIIADSIWKMIFHVQGIDKLVISRADCTVVFTVNPELVQGDSLRREIGRRGGEVLN